MGIQCWPRLSTGDTVAIWYVNLTASQLKAIGYFPVVTAGSSEVIWRRY